MRTLLFLPTVLCLFAGAHAGSASTRLTAAPRASEPAWLARHDKITAAAAADPDVVLLGDSITQGWDFQQPLLSATLPHLRVINAGMASDRVEHVLWRVEHGTFDKARPQVVVLLAGINNLAVNTPEQIAGGIDDVIAALATRSPKTKVLLLGLFPSGHEADHKRRPQVKAVNELLAKRADGERVRFVDLGPKLLEADGTLAKTTAFDYLHLTKRGYQIWAEALGPAIAEMLNAAKKSG